MLQDVYTTAEERMRKAIEANQNELAGIRTGRASISLLDRIQVEAYGSMTPLKAVATVSTPDARTLQISVFDRSTVGAVRKAIETSDLRLTPNVDGQNIRLSIPPLTEERRRELVKLVGKRIEDGKVVIRNVRHKATDEIKALVKSGDVTEDEVKRANETVQKLTDKFVKELDALAATKEKEIMAV